MSKTYLRRFCLDISSKTSAKKVNVFLRVCLFVCVCFVDFLAPILHQPSPILSECSSIFYYFWYFQFLNTSFLPLFYILQLFERLCPPVLHCSTFYLNVSISFFNKVFYIFFKILTLFATKPIICFSLSLFAILITASNLFFVSLYIISSCFHL